MPTRNINLTPEQNAFIDEVIEAGDYQNASEPFATRSGPCSSAALNWKGYASRSTLEPMPSSVASPPRCLTRSLTISGFACCRDAS